MHLRLKLNKCLEKFYFHLYFSFWFIFSVFLFCLSKHGFIYLCGNIFLFPFSLISNFSNFFFFSFFFFTTNASVKNNNVTYLLFCVMNWYLQDECVEIELLGLKVMLP